MKKMILCSALSIVMTSPVFAEQPVNQEFPSPVPLKTPVLNPTGPDDVTQPGQPPVQATEAINCKYKIPPKVTNVEQPLIVTWVKNAIHEIFTMSPGIMDSQLASIQNCFTDQGWTGYRDALQKSGNLDAIKSQSLSMTSQVLADPVFTEVKDNQWKLSMPLRVTYKSPSETITQDLTINVVVARKTSGELGILQIVAVPKETAPVAGPGAPVGPMVPR